MNQEHDYIKQRRQGGGCCGFPNAKSEEEWPADLPDARDDFLGCGLALLELKWPKLHSGAGQDTRHK